MFVEESGFANGSSCLLPPASRGRGLWPETSLHSSSGFRSAQAASPRRSIPPSFPVAVPLLLAREGLPNSVAAGRTRVLAHQLSKTDTQCLVITALSSHDLFTIPTVITVAMMRYCLRTLPVGFNVFFREGAAVSGVRAVTRSRGFVLSGDDLRASSPRTRPLT